MVLVASLIFAHVILRLAIGLDRREIDFYLARVKELGDNMPERRRGVPPSKIKHLQITWNDI